MRARYVATFFVSLFCICLELFFTRILNLKAWNHLVYIIIPVAILGYGIGGNLYLVFKEKVDRYPESRIIAATMLFLSATTLETFFIVAAIPIVLAPYFELRVGLLAVALLLVAYTLILLPFGIIGFLITYIFSHNPSNTNRLYFVDLLGAGAGATLFFVLINQLAVFHSLFLLSSIALLFAVVLRFHARLRLLLAALVVATSLMTLAFVPEPKNYAIDPSKGWEWIPGYAHAGQYQTVVSQWHPLGLTEIYRITDAGLGKLLFDENYGTFEINLDPAPEFSYVATNALSGTPIFHLSPEGRKGSGPQVRPFSQAMEAPYLLLKNPNVVIIGTGGGRDIFMAKTHGAGEIAGAEINPATYKNMAPGGALFDYSGQVYAQPGVSVANVDGRYLVKTLSRGHYNLIVLNGVDTFSGLSSGAYAYAESYLYTKDAVIDYLRILASDGILNFNRWYFPGRPREDLRLLAICLDALRDSAVPNPWDHIIMGAHNSWVIMLVRKTPFGAAEWRRISDYFDHHQARLIYPTVTDINRATETPPINYYNLYAKAFREGSAKEFADAYPYDISVVTDDNPFFYKYYKFNPKNPLYIEMFHHTGTIIFITQAAVLIQALLFISAFIFVPLQVFKRRRLETVNRKILIPFVVYFSCLGVGFMFIEIPLMQRFTLLLGSPIHAISVTLAALLICSGIGSFVGSHFSESTSHLSIWSPAICLAGLVTILILAGRFIVDHSLNSALAYRTAVVCLLLLPIGLCLGSFFPAGLHLVGRKHQGMIPWAWGINCGFSVLGSIISIILAQYSGFSTVLMLAIVIYLLATVAYVRLRGSLASSQGIARINL